MNRLVFPIFRSHDSGGPSLSRERDGYNSRDGFNSRGSRERDRDVEDRRDPHDDKDRRDDRRGDRGGEYDGPSGMQPDGIIEVQFQSI